MQEAGHSHQTLSQVFPQHIGLTCDSWNILEFSVLHVLRKAFARVLLVFLSKSLCTNNNPENDDETVMKSALHTRILEIHNGMV